MQREARFCIKHQNKVWILGGCYSIMQRRSNTGRLKRFIQDLKTPIWRPAEGEVSDLAYKVKVQRDTTPNAL